jgi:ubiquitin C-terminal hydrolase
MAHIVSLNSCSLAPWVYQGIYEGLSKMGSALDAIISACRLQKKYNQLKDKDLLPIAPLFRNRGNSCFLSSAFWFLINEPFFMEELPKAIQRQKGDKKALLQALSRFLRECQQASGEISGEKLNEFRALLGKVNNQFNKTDWIQEDAPSVIRILTDLVFENSRHTQTLFEERIWVRTRFLVPDLEEKRMRIEPNYGLLLIDNNGKKTIQKNLENHFKDSGKASLKINEQEFQCKSTVLYFEREPEFLILNLKSKQKLDVEDLLITLGKGTYRLTSAIHHHGLDGAGHYTTTLRKEGMWVHCDDLAPCPVVPTSAPTEPAVCLFYRRV